MTSAVHPLLILADLVGPQLNSCDLSRNLVTLADLCDLSLPPVTLANLCDLSRPPVTLAGLL